jgi:hypothetical protein
MLRGHRATTWCLATGLGVVVLLLRKSHESSDRAALLVTPSRSWTATPEPTRPAPTLTFAPSASPTTSSPSALPTAAPNTVAPSATAAPTARLDAAFNETAAFAYLYDLTWNIDCPGVPFAWCGDATCRVNGDGLTASCGCVQMSGGEGEVAGLQMQRSLSYLVTSPIVRHALWLHSVNESGTGAQLLCAAVRKGNLWISAGFGQSPCKRAANLPRRRASPPRAPR